MKRTAGLVAVGALTLAGSVWAIADGAVGLGVTCLMFGLALLAVPLAQHAPDGSGPRLEDGAVVIRVNPVRRVLIVLGAALFMAMGALMLFAWSGPARIAGAAALLVFGTFTVIGLWRLRGPWRLLLTRAGLRWDAGVPGPFVAWDDVERAYMLSIHGSNSLALDLRRPQRRTGLAALITRADRAVGGGDANIPLDQLSVDDELLLSLVTVCARDPRARDSVVSEATVRRLEA